MKRLSVLALALVLSLSLMIPAAAVSDESDFAAVAQLFEDAPVNGAEETAFNDAGGVIRNEGGTVFNNGGLVWNEGGIVFNNKGVVYNSGGTVFNNSGSVYNSGGEVINNGGMVYGADMSPVMDGEPVDEGEAVVVPDESAPLHRLTFSRDYSEFADIQGQKEEGNSLYIQQGQSCTFTPKEGYVLCAADSQSGKWTVNEDGSYTLSDVEKDVTVSLGFLHIEMPRFSAVKEGYGMQKPKSILMENPSDMDVRVKNILLSGDDAEAFVLSRTSGAKVEAGERVDNFWTVRPEIGCETGTYTAQISVIFSNGSRYETEIVFIVK